MTELPSKVNTDKPALSDLIQGHSPPKWVIEMQNHYRRTGQYRPEDLYRLLGDPTKSVEVGARNSLVKNFNVPTR